MAEETLVKEILTQEMIRLGADLTRRLDHLGWPVVASLWLFDSQRNSWRLVLASPRANTAGPREAYQSVQSALTDLNTTSLSLNDIVVVAPEDPLIRLLASVIKVQPGLSGLRFSRNVIDGHFIDDTYVYRMNPPNAVK